MFSLLSLKSSVKHNRKHEAPHRDTSAAVMALLIVTVATISEDWREVGKQGLCQLVKGWLNGQ